MQKIFFIIFVNHWYTGVYEEKFWRQLQNTIEIK